MPYASKAQLGLFHSPNSPVSQNVVDEFDQASKGESGLPEHVAKKKKAKPGSDAHRKAHMGAVIAKAHAAYKAKYGNQQSENPYNSQSL